MITHCCRSQNSPRCLVFEREKRNEGKYRKYLGKENIWRLEWKEKEYTIWRMKLFSLWRIRKIFGACVLAHSIDKNLYDYYSLCENNPNKRQTAKCRSYHLISQ